MKKTKTSGTSRAAVKKKKRRTSLFLIIKLILILGILYALIFYTPIFKVQSISVTGNSVVSEQEVIDASAILPGQHMLKLNRNKIQQNIEKIAYISTATLEYKWPNRVNLAVTEGNVVANIKCPDGYAAVDHNNKVLEVNSQPKSFPIIEGISVQKNVVGEKIAIDETDKFDIILLYVELLSKRNLLDQFKSFKMEGYSLRAEMKTGIKVVFGSREDADYKISALMESIKNSPGVSIGTFDATNPKRVVYSID